MPHDVSLIATIAASFGLALIFGFIAARLKMPPLVGYMLMVQQDPGIGLLPGQEI